MPLTEEVKAVLGDQFTEANLIEQLTPDFHSKLGETHVIRTKEDDESFVSSQVTAGVDAKIGEKIKELHQKYEDDILEVTGLRKKVNEKAYDFNKRILADLKTRSEATGGDQMLKDQIATLTESLTTKETEHATKLTEIQKAAFQKQLKLVVKSEFDGRQIDIPAKITTEEAKQKYISDQKRLLEQDFLNKYTPKEDNDGNIVYYLGDKQQINTTNGQPLSASDLISSEYGSYFSTQATKLGGAGSGKDGLPANGFTTSEAIYAHLESKGLERFTHAFNTEAAKLIKEHGIVV